MTERGGRKTIPWPHQARPADPFRDFDDGGFFVFVPAIMSVGLVFSIITLVRDLFRFTGARARERRTELEAATVVNDLVGRDPDGLQHQGLLSRRAYLFTAVVLAIAAVYIGVGSVANYLRQDGYVANIAWLLGLGLSVALLFGFLAVLAMVVFHTFPTPPPWTNQALRTAPLTVNPKRIGQGPPLALTITMIGAAFATMIITLVVATGQKLTETIDEPIVDWLSEVQWLDALAAFDPFGSTLVTIAFVALIGLSGFRCRVMAVVYPAAFAVAWLSVEILQHTIDRARPSGYEGFESFPSGHMVQVVFIAGLLPTALGVLLTSRRLVTISRIVLVIATLATGLHRVYIAKHWPLDVLGGFGLGATIVLGAHWVLEHRGWHRTCAHCRWSTEPGLVPWQRGIINLHPTTAAWIGRSGSALAVAAAAALGAATLWVGLPTDPEGSGIGSAVSAPVQLALAALMAVAGLLALRWKAIGAFAMAVAAVGLGVFASVEYVPQLAFLLAAGLLIPAVLTWFSWQPTASLGSIAALAVLTATALTGTGLGVREVHEHYFGPSHPSSVTEPLASDADWLWLGGVDHNSASITAGTFTPGAAVDLQFWETTDEATPARLIRTFASDSGVVRFELDDLRSATGYNYRVMENHGNHVDPPEASGGADASFRTFDSGSQDLVIAIGACARRASNGSVFDAIVGENADLYLAIGDLHYGNLESGEPGPHIVEYGRSLSQPAQGSLFSSVPTAYVWDDHDYGPNDGDRNSSTRAAVSAAYREAVPSYSVDPNLDAPIAQAFTLGRVRFIVTDTRSQRDATTMLGSDQLEWLQNELVAASTSHALVVWANPTPWVGAETASGDTWASYADERALISQTIADHEISNLLMVSGDAHMVAIDDGSNTGYAADGGGGFPLLHAGALDRPGSIKGGPYSHGAFPGGGQYGRLTIEDNGSDTVRVRLSGHTWEGIELVALEFTIEVPDSSADT